MRALFDACCAHETARDHRACNPTLTLNVARRCAPTCRAVAAIIASGDKKLTLDRALRRSGGAVLCCAADASVQSRRVAVVEATGPRLCINKGRRHRRRGRGSPRHDVAAFVQQRDELVLAELALQRPPRADRSTDRTCRSARRRTSCAATSSRTTCEPISLPACVRPRPCGASELHRRAALQLARANAAAEGERRFDGAGQRLRRTPRPNAMPRAAVVAAMWSS